METQVKHGSRFNAVTNLPHRTHEDIKNATHFSRGVEHLSTVAVVTAVF